MSEELWFDLVKLAAFAAAPWVVALVVVGFMKLHVWSVRASYFVRRIARR